MSIFVILETVTDWGMADDGSVDKKIIIGYTDDEEKAKEYVRHNLFKLVYELVEELPEDEKWLLFVS